MENFIAKCRFQMEFKTNHLTTILSSLNRESFNQFIFDMWELGNKHTQKNFIDLKKKPRLGPGVFEQQFIHWDKPQYPKSYQGFNLIVPFFQPAEALINSNNINTLLKRESLILKKYDRTIKRRIKDWYWPQDGEFAASNIYFVSNLIGIEKKIYYNKILPKLSEIVKPSPYFNKIGIGTYDSFINRVPQKTETVLKKLISNSQFETSLFYHEGRVFIEQHLPENFLQSGVLPKSLNPCDTVITLLPKNNIEIVKEFEDILNRNFKEDEMEKFLKKYYKVIFSNRYDRIETQLWLRFPELDINRKERRLDIFLRNAIEKDWELIELKGRSKIISNYRDIPTLSSTMTGAISQLRNYERILQQDSVKKKMKEQGIDYYEPQLRLVVGGKPEISIEQWRRIKVDNEKGLRITTFEDIMQEMKMRYLDFVSLIKSS